MKGICVLGLEPKAPPDYYFQRQAIKTLAGRYKSIKIRPIGKSLCKRSITALTLGRGGGTALYAAAFHGMEWLNTLIVIKFIEECALAYENRTSLQGSYMFDILNKRSLTVIPCVNPDGVEIQLCGAGSCPEYEKLIRRATGDTTRWQANARGVDLNHNFPSGWKRLKLMEVDSGITAPSPTRYGGEKPFSEPETVALRNLCLNNSISHAIAFHSQGREVYCRFGKAMPKGEMLGETFAREAGYKISHPAGLAVGGGFKDWLIQELRIPSLTVETGLGKNPLPISDFSEEYSRVRRALVKCLTLDL